MTTPRKISETVHLYSEGQKPGTGGPLCQKVYGGMTLREMLGANMVLPVVSYLVNCEACLRAMGRSRNEQPEPPSMIGSAEQRVKSRWPRGGDDEHRSIWRSDDLELMDDDGPLGMDWEEAAEHPSVRAHWAKRARGAGNLRPNGAQERAMIKISVDMEVSGGKYTIVLKAPGIETQRHEVQQRRRGAGRFAAGLRPTQKPLTCDMPLELHSKQRKRLHSQPCSTTNPR